MLLSLTARMIVHSAREEEAASTRRRQSMIPKSGYRFSEKIMAQQ